MITPQLYDLILHLVLLLFLPFVGTVFADSMHMFVIRQFLFSGTTTDQQVHHIFPSGQA